MSTHRILYLPIETKTRELHGKCFLAARAVERGWIVVTGNQSEIHKLMRRAPPGVYVEISIPAHKAAWLAELRNAGHRIANLCEESLIYSDARDYCERKLGPGTMPSVDRLLVLGPTNAKHIERFRPEFLDKIAITGNPRFDTLRPELRITYEARANIIRKRFGRLVLVNTNFGRCNPPGRSTDIIAVLKHNNMLADSEHEDFIVRQIAYKRRQMAGLQILLEEFAEKRVLDHIIVRPHPVENHEVWREWATHPNIDVFHDKTAIEWMLAAEAVLHPGCTTGIEALILDRPVFAYVPEPNSEFLNPSDSVSEHIVSVDELIRSLFKLREMHQIQLSKKHEKQRANLSSFIANLEFRFSADHILDELEKLEPSRTIPPRVSIPLWISYKRLKYRLLNQIAKLRRKRKKGKQQKFPDTSTVELISILSPWIHTGTITKTPRITPINRRLWIWR